MLHTSSYNIGVT